MKATEKGYGCGKKDMQADGVKGEDPGDRQRWRQIEMETNERLFQPLKAPVKTSDGTFFCLQ